MLQAASWSHLLEGGARSEGRVGEDSFIDCCSKGKQEGWWGRGWLRGERGCL